MSSDVDIEFVSTYVCRLDTRNWVFAFFSYGNKWRKWHKAFLAHMQPTVARQYHIFELKAARRLLWNLFDTPQDFMKHIRQCVKAFSWSALRVKQSISA